MKIVGVSNFSNETVSDILVCDKVNKYYGEKFVDMLNAEISDYDRYFYKLVDDDYKLYVWEP